MHLYSVCMFVCVRAAQEEVAQIKLSRALATVTPVVLSSHFLFAGCMYGNMTGLPQFISA